MKFSIVRIDKQHITRLSVKSAEWFMERIQTDTKGEDIGRLRHHIAQFGDDGSYDKEMALARICPSVELEKLPNGRLEVVAFNGLIVLHVADLLSVDDLKAVKEAAKQLPMTFAAFVGADGRSVEIMVRVAMKDGMQPQTEAEMDACCKAAYETALGVYNGILPKSVDRQMVSARTSLRMTLDKIPYFQPSAMPLMVASGLMSLQPEHDLSLEVPVSQQSPDMSLYAVYEQMYERAADEAWQETAGVVDSQRREAYLTELVLRMADMGVPEEETYIHLRNHHKYKSHYDETVLRAVVSSVYTEHKPKLRGNEDQVSQRTHRLIRFLTTRYVFRYNPVMGYTEYRPNHTWIGNWQPCDENVINGMTIEARLANIDARDKDVCRYVRSNMIRRCDPVGDYLLSVADKWDGKTDHIAMLARCVSCNLPQWERWFRKWFLSMVAQWVMPHQEYGNSVVPLLISAQGDGKTTFCRNILPKELRWGFLENLDVSEKRQTLQSMHNFLLINLDEFNQISPKLQEGFLKNVIQLPSVKIKRPYGKHVEEFRRYASFIATTNESNVLADPTGNRRFICVQLTAPVNTAYKPNYEALYGQAYTIIRQRDEQWWFTPKEVKEIIHHNRSFEVVPPVVQFFNEYFEVPEREENGEWMTPTVIYEYLRKKLGSSLRLTGVSAFGRYLGHIPDIHQKRISKGKVYLVRKK